MVEESITLNPPNISVGTHSARGQSTTPTMGGGHILNQNSSHFLPGVSGLDRLPFGFTQYKGANITNSQQYFESPSNEGRNLN